MDHVRPRGSGTLLDGSRSHIILMPQSGVVPAVNGSPEVSGRPLFGETQSEKEKKKKKSLTERGLLTSFVSASRTSLTRLSQIQYFLILNSA